MKDIKDMVFSRNVFKNYANTIIVPGNLECNNTVSFVSLMSFNDLYMSRLCPDILILAGSESPPESVSCRS